MSNLLQLIPSYNTVKDRVIVPLFKGHYSLLEINNPRLINYYMNKTKCVMLKVTDFLLTSLLEISRPHLAVTISSSNKNILKAHAWKNHVLSIYEDVRSLSFSSQGVELFHC